MRYLNRIVFLNSAHIPYAEVELNGNVHFIGTQGVGKSTLLRALLFFYNADKLKLGIPKEKKSFDAFYFMYANSYIVYEVIRENGSYCVLAFRSQGRTCFRFIDAEYRKEWFVNTTGEVSSDWNIIRKRIDKSHYSSPIIDRYETYRDIIFGNNRGHRVEYRKFAITESTKYQNIPRTIQNVFLNSKLDADFIKDTIIHSMNDEEVNIDLNYYRGQVSEFEKEYEDIRRWFVKNKQGEITVRKQVERVINNYRDLLYRKQQIEDSCRELNYAVRYTYERLPQVKEEKNRSEAALQKTREQLQELQKNFGKKRDELLKRIAELDLRLKDIKQKKESYAANKIDEIIGRCEKESVWLTEKKQLEEMKSNLTRQYEDVTEKYKLLQNKLQQDLQAFQQLQQQRINKQKEQLNQHIEQLLNERERSRETVRQRFEGSIRLSDEKIATLRDEQEACRKESYKLEYNRPYDHEIKNCKEEVKQLEAREKEIRVEAGQRQEKIDALIRECELERKALDIQYHQQLHEAQQSKEELEKKLFETDALLASWKGSLYEWLDQNKPDWSLNIGKLVNDYSILYNTELNPRIDTPTNTLFGVSIDLSELPSTVRTPENILAEKNEIEDKIAKNKQLHIDIQSQQETEIQALEKKYSQKVKLLRSEKHMLEAEATQLPQKKKALLVKQDEWQRKDQEWRQKEKENYDLRLNNISHLFLLAEEERKKQITDREKQYKVCDKQYGESREKIVKASEEFEHAAQAETNQKQTNTDKQEQQLKSMMDAELAGKGADMETLRQCDASLNSVQQELLFIESNRELVYSYQYDKRELFDHEVEFRQMKKEAEAKRDQLEEAHNLRREKLTSQKASSEHELDVKIKELTELEEGLSMTDKFIQDDNSCPSFLSQVGERTNRKSCQQILNELKENIYLRRDKQDAFKQSVNLFKSNFSTKNTFQFRVDLNTDDDYMDFASGLADFVENNKIEDYLKRTGERYLEILTRVSREVGEVTKHESEVEKTINDINYDFKSKNFAGVIKDISLRSRPTSDKLMQLMLKIKAFNDEHQFSMGEMNLFSMNSRDEINEQAISYLLAFMKFLQDDAHRSRLTLSDTFKLEFKVVENDNDTGWVEKISNVGSDGTDILVKAMVNIMLINVFKEKVSRKFGDFKLHCMMDEIGKLHPNNVKGILDFANKRNILLINSSPTTYNVSDYRYTYLLSKDNNSNTQVVPLITRKEEFLKNEVK